MSKKMLTKILTAFGMIAVFLPCAIYGGWPLRIILGAIAVMTAHETASLTDGQQHLPMTALNSVFLLILLFTPKAYFIAIISIFLLILFGIELTDEKTTTDFVAYTFLIMCMMGIGLTCLRDLYDAGNGFLKFLYVALACFGCDTGAYFVGVFFGKHKLIPRVSPNKTWEGAFGGYVTGLVLSLVFGLMTLKMLPSSLIFAGSFLMPLTAQLGDLSFSSIKRRFGIKDFGNLFPGHGGALDRIDSIIFCLITFSGLLILWGF